MSLGLGVVQRRILKTLERIEQESPGGWVRRGELVTPKEGQKIERSDVSSTARAVKGLIERDLVEGRDDYVGYGRQSVVRLIKNARSPRLDAEEERRIRLDLDSQIVELNNTLRTRRSRIRVETRDLPFDRVMVTDRETGKFYTAYHFY
ncbi:hypothetical protein ACH4Y0_02590 [Streptomyces sp. NPDC020707]|uniref:hypothetical protein n=1 Tax=Streptomyces sp. NPDC020707 TaxID=3365084 RepID=UPI0037998099